MVFTKNNLVQQNVFRTPDIKVLKVTPLGIICNLETVICGMFRRGEHCDQTARIPDSLSLH